MHVEDDCIEEMLSPSEIALRIDCARLPISKSWYNQSSAFHTAISLCFVTSGFGLMTNFPPFMQSAVQPRAAQHSARSTKSPTRDQKSLRANHGDFFSRGFEETDEAGKARTYIGILQSADGAGKKLSNTASSEGSVHAVKLAACPPARK